MFIKQGMSLQAVKVYKNFAECRTDWNGFAREASANNDFEYDPDNFLYYRARAITADYPNSNADYFSLATLKDSHKTFIGKAVFLNHANDDPAKAFGLVLDAEFVPTPDAPSSHGTAYIEILAALDKELTEELHPGLIRRVQAGIINETSMSCVCSTSVCGFCDHVAHRPEELCAHLNPNDFGYVKGKRVAGRDTPVYEISEDVTFIEDSLVSQAADPTAKVLEVMASVKNPDDIDSMTVGELKSKLKQISDLLNSI